MALKFIGERTVGTLNGMKSGFVKDDLYRVYDAGILVPGGVSVDHGDFVSWDGTKWVNETGVKMATSLDTASIDDIKELIPESASAENQLATVADIGALKTGDGLVDADLIIVPNNKVSSLYTERAAIELRVEYDEGEVPNFAVEISTGGTTTITVSAQFGELSAPLQPSVAGGTSIESGKFYQITCVGSCWTLAEFTSL